MRIALCTAVAAATLVGGCATGPDRYTNTGWEEYRKYDYDRPDPNYGGYDAARYHRQGSSYRERRLNKDDRLYRGQDGQYYCRRDDGTTGLVVGALAGGVLGNVIAPGDSQTIGTLLGAGIGAVLGREVDRGSARCR